MTIARPSFLLLALSLQLCLYIQSLGTQKPLVAQRDSQELPRLIKALGTNPDPVIRVLERDYLRVNMQKRLIAIARKSSKARARVIQALIAAFRDSTVENRSQLWIGACEVFVGLKAIEAIDFLVEHIDYDARPGGYLTGSCCPAVYAVIRMSKVSVPMLEQVFHKPEASIGKRYFAAVALGEIGGGKAKEALGRSLDIETNIFVTNTIRTYIGKLSKETNKGNRLVVK